MATHPGKGGYLGDPRHECRCSPDEIQRDRARISGPLLDRIDIHVEDPALSLAELRNEKLGNLPPRCATASKPPGYVSSSDLPAQKSRPTPA